MSAHNYPAICHSKSAQPQLIYLYKLSPLINK